VLILDAGPTLVGLESTVVDVRRNLGNIPPGAVTREMLEAHGHVSVEYVGKIEENGAVPSPGMKYRHYAQTYQFFFSVTLTNSAKPRHNSDRFRWSGCHFVWKTQHHIHQSGSDQHSAAARIYMALRQAEQFGRTAYVQLMDEEVLVLPTMSESEKPLVRQESWLIKVARTGLVAALYVVLTYLPVFQFSFWPIAIQSLRKFNVTTSHLG